MTQYKIPVTWECWALLNVEAKSLEEAMNIAAQSSSTSVGEYIEDSWKVDKEGITIHNRELSQSGLRQAGILVWRDES